MPGQLTDPRPAPPLFFARINCYRADEAVDSRTIRHIQALLIRAGVVDPRGLELEGRASASGGIAARTLMELRIQVESFTPEMADRAAHAWRRFGRGKHPAALNFGDCCTYALAEKLGLPILCTGNDFAQTDLPVLRPPAS